MTFIHTVTGVASPGASGMAAGIMAMWMKKNANMQGRVHLRRLAKSLTDERTIKTLLGMARETEADIEASLSAKSP